MGFLSDKTLQLPQVCGIDLVDKRIGDFHIPLPHVPEPHEQLEQRGLPAAAASHNAHDAVLRNLHRYIRKDGFAPVGKGDLLRRRARKGDFRLAGDFLHHWDFVQNIQHPVTRRKGVLQGAAQRRQRNHRAKGGEQGDGGDQHPIKAHGAALAEQGGNKQHHKIKGQHHGIGHCRIAAGGAFHAFFVLSKVIGFLIHRRQTLFALPILQGFRKPSQAVQHKAGKLPGFGAEPNPVVPAELGRYQRNDNSHGEIRRQRNETQQPVIGADE